MIKLICLVILYRWLCSATDLGVVKRIKCNGEGWDQPNDGAQVEIDLKGVDTSGRVFDERIVSFEIGEGIDTQVPRGVEIGLEKMKV